MAPPDHGFSARLAGLANAASQEAHGGHLKLLGDLGDGQDLLSRRQLRANSKASTLWCNCVPRGSADVPRYPATGAGGLRSAAFERRTIDLDFAVLWVLGCTANPVSSYA